MGAPMILGAALGGGISAARGGNPLLGALLGGVGGGMFGAASGAANAAATAGMTGAAPASIGTTAAAATPASALQGATSSIFANPTMPVYGATGGSTGLIPSITAPATLADQFKAVGQFSRENPFAMQMAANAAQEEFRQKQVQNPGLLRGRPAEEQAMPYSSPIPKISLL